MHGQAVLETPIGPISVFYREHPPRVVSIRLHGPGGSTGLQAAAAGMPREAGLVCELIKDYLRGMDIKPPWELLAMDHLGLFQKRVLNETAKIPFGSLKTYKSLAEAAGRPGAFRSAGSALAKNPFPLIIPCHRIIRSSGSTGNFTAGPEVKKLLIGFEKTGSWSLQKGPAGQP